LNADNSQAEEVPALVPSSLAVSPDGRYVVCSCQNAPILMVYSLPNLEQVTVADLPKPALGLSFARGTKLYISMEGPEYLLVFDMKPDGGLILAEGDAVVDVVVKYAAEKEFQGHKMDSADEKQAGGAAGLAKKQITNKYWKELYVRKQKQQQQQQLEAAKAPS